MTITESTPLTDDYRLRDILRSTARRLGRAQVHLKLLSITSFREAHLLDVNEGDETTRLTYTTDDHRWLRTMPAGEAPIDAKSCAEDHPH